MQAYRFANGQTVLPRTNQKPALLVTPANSEKRRIKPISAPLAFEPYDFVAAIFPDPEHRDRIAVYLVPSAVAAPEMKRLLQAWMDADPDRDRDNRVFRIRFDDAGERTGWTEEYGYGAKWAEYRVSDLEPSAVPSERPVKEETGEQATLRRRQGLERHRQEIAHDFGVAPEAVEIIVRF